MSADGFTVKDATGKAHRFEPAPFDIEVVDVWPPGTLTDAAKDAYDALAAAGRIIPRGLVTRDAAGRVIVRYMADIPEQWIRQELKEARINGRQIGIEQAIARTVAQRWTETSVSPLPIKAARSTQTIQRYRRDDDE